MKKLGKKAISLLLVLVMSLSLITSSGFGFAVSEDESEDTLNVISETADAEETAVEEESLNTQAVETPEPAEADVQVEAEADAEAVTLVIPDADTAEDADVPEADTEEAPPAEYEEEILPEETEQEYAEPEEQADEPEEEEIPEEESAEPDEEEDALAEQTVKVIVYTAATYESRLLNSADITLNGEMPEDASAKAYPVSVDIDDENVLAAYNVTIFDADGNEFRPEDETVRVTVDHSAVQKAVSVDADIQVYELEDEDADAEEIADVETADDGVTFDADSDASVYAVATEDAMATWTARSGGVRVTATALESALPENAELSVELYDEDDKEYAAAGDALDLDEDTGMAAMDISFKVNGREVEPYSPVYLSVNFSAILPEDADTDTLEVQHLEKDGNDVTPVAVAEAGEEINAATAVAKFTVESFSTFTVKWEWKEQTGSTSSVSLSATVYVDGVELDLSDLLEDDTITFTSQDEELDLETLLYDIGYDGGDYLLDYAYVEYTSTSSGFPGQGGGTGTTETIGSQTDPVLAVEKQSGASSNFIVVQEGKTTSITASSDNSNNVHVYVYYTTPEFSVEITPVEEDEDEDWLLQAVLSHAGDYESVEYEWSVTDTDGDPTELAYVVEWDVEFGSALIVWSSAAQDEDQITVHLKVTITREDGSTAVAETSYTLEYGDEEVDIQLTYGPDKTPVPAGISVTLTNTVTGAIYSEITDDNGQIEIELEPGIYVISATYTVEGATYSCEETLALHNAVASLNDRFYYVNLNYAGADKTSGALDSDKEDWNHVDVKMAVSSSNSGVIRSEVILDLIGCVITDEDGYVKYTATEDSIAEGASSGEWQIYFYEGEDTSGTESHSISFATTDTITFTYTLHWADSDEDPEVYSVSVDAGTVYASGSTYAANGQRAYKLYNYLYGTSYSSDAELIASGVEYVDISGMSMMLVAAILCDSSTIEGAGVVTGTAGMWGMDFALSIDSFTALGANWIFDLEKTYLNSSMTAGMFTFHLYDADFDSSTGLWSLEEGGFNDVMTNSAAVKRINGNSSDTIEGTYVPFSNSVASENRNHYYIVCEDAGDEPYTDYDGTVFGIDVYVGIDDDGETVVSPVYYILTSDGDGGYTAEPYNEGDGKITFGEDNYPTFHFTNAYKTNVEISKQSSSGVSLTTAEFTLTQAAVVYDEDGEATGEYDYYYYSPGNPDTETGDPWTRCDKDVFNTGRTSEKFELSSVTLETPWDGYYILRETGSQNGYIALPYGIKFEMLDRLVDPDTLTWVDEDGNPVSDEDAGCRVSDYFIASSESIVINIINDYYEYPVEIYKYSENEDGETVSLEGAKFVLIREVDEETEYAILTADNEHDCYILNSWTEDETEATGLSSGEDGYIRIGYTENSDGEDVHIGGLETGTYYLVETEAPEGYAMLDDPIEFTLSAEGVVTCDDPFEKAVGVRNYRAAGKTVDVEDGTEVKVGDELTYAISYCNQYDVPATVFITDQLDPGLDYVSSVPAGDYDEDTRTVTWTVENVAAGAEGHVTLTAVVNEDAMEYDEVTNTASVQVGDDQAVETNPVVNPLTPEKTVDVGDKTEVAVGDVLVYMISYHNYTDDTADIVITDMLDEGVDYVSSDPTGAYDETTHTVTWTIAGVEPDDVGHVTLTVQVNKNAKKNAEVENSAGVTVGNENEVTTNTVINPIEPDDPQDPVKSVDVGDGTEVKVGDTLVYTITYYNYNNEPATVYITDYLDAGVDFVSASDDGSYSDGADKTVTWVLEDVPAFTEGSVTLTVTVNEFAKIKACDDDMQTVYNSAEVKIGNEYTGNTNTVKNPLEPDDPVDPVKSTDTDPETGTYVGDEIIYTITYYNNNNVPATVTITDELDEGVDYVDSEPEGGYDETTHIVTWTIEDVAAFTKGSVELTVRVNEKAMSAGEVDNTAGVQIGNETAVDTNTVEIPLTDDPQDPEKSADVEENYQASVGDEITYTITYYNNYNSPAIVTITDELDEGVDFVSATDYGEYDESTHTVTWTLNTVGAFTGGSVELTVAVNENAKVKAEVDNTAGVQIGNDVAVDTNTVTIPLGPDEPEDPGKSSDVEPGAETRIGDEITYTITYYNNNNVPADVIITDALDEGVDFVSATDDGVYDEENHTVIWTLENVTAFTEGSVELIVKVNENAKTEAGVNNTAEVQIGNEYSVETNPVYIPLEPDEPQDPEKTANVEEDADVAVGDEITYTIKYYNNYNDAVKVVITDQLDEGVDFISATDGGVYDETTHIVTWTIENVAAFTQGTVEVTVEVNESAKIKAEVDNTASVQIGNSPAVDTNTVKNPIEPDDPEDPEKKADVEEGAYVSVGDKITYTITYYNNNKTAADVIITDALDEGADFVSATSGGVYDKDTHTVTWTIKDVAAFTEGSVELTVMVNDNAKASTENTADVQIGNEPEVATNTVEIPVDVRTGISGTKIWDDADDQDGKRPESVILVVYGNGQEVCRLEVEAGQYNLLDRIAAFFTGRTLSTENSWVWSVTDLPKYDENGNEIIYIVEEIPVADYETTYSEDTLEITNYHEPELINPDNPNPNPDDPNPQPAPGELTVVKVWDDDENRDGIRPDSIRVQLTADGQSYGEAVTLSDENDWTYTWTGLYTYSDGEKIAYAVTEAGVPEGYETEITGEVSDGLITITNTHEPELINPENPEPDPDDPNPDVPAPGDLTVTKVWDDNNNQDGMRDTYAVTLTGTADGETVYEDTRTLDPGTTTYTWTSLYKYADGQEIDYSVSETQVPDGYKDTVEGSAESGFTVINSHTPEKINTGDGDPDTDGKISVIKIWEGDEETYNHRPDSVEIELLANGEDTDQVLILNEANNWSGEFTNLDKYADGVEIEYTVKEITKDALQYYTPSIEGSVEEGFTITNLREYFDIDEEIVPDDEEDHPDQWVKKESVNAANHIEIEMSTYLPVIEPDELGNGAFTMNFHEVLDSHLDLDEVDTDFSVYLNRSTASPASAVNPLAVGTGHDELNHQYYTVTIHPDDGCSFHVDVNLTAMYRDGVIDDDDLTGDTQIIIFFYADLNGTGLNGSYTSTVWYDVYDGEEWQYTSNVDVVEVYTFEIYIIKYDTSLVEDDDYESAPVEGATLGLYYDKECTDPVMRYDEPYTLISNENGEIIFYSLAEGTYYVKEINAPDGYVLSDQVLEITLDENLANDIDNYIYRTSYGNDPIQPGEARDPEKSSNVEEGSGTAVGNEITYTIIYYNNYNDSETVTITDKLDEGLTFVSAANGGVYDAETHTVTWIIEDVAPFTEGSVELTVTVNEKALTTDSVSNTAAVQIGDDPAVDTNTVEIPLNTDEPRAPEKTSDIADGVAVSVGEDVTYTITYYNNYAEPKTVTITDVLAEGVDFVTATDGGVYDEDTHTVIWNLEDVAALTGGNVELTVTVNEDAARADGISNTASVQIGNDASVDTNTVAIPLKETESSTPDDTNPDSGTPNNGNNGNNGGTTGGNNGGTTGSNGGNTGTSKTLPQTGQLNWPIWLFGGLGIIVLAVGIIMMLTGKKGKREA